MTGQLSAAQVAVLGPTDCTTVERIWAREVEELVAVRREPGGIVPLRNGDPR